MLKLIGNISIGLLRRPAKFSGIPSSNTEILKVMVNPIWRLNRHLGSRSKVKTDPERIYGLIATTCKNLVETGQAVPEILQILSSSICSLSFTIGKNPMFNPVVWVGVWF